MGKKINWNNIRSNANAAESIPLTYAELLLGQNLPFAGNVQGISELETVSNKEEQKSEVTDIPDHFKEIKAKLSESLTLEKNGNSKAVLKEDNRPVSKDTIVHNVQSPIESLEYEYEGKVYKQLIHEKTKVESFDVIFLGDTDHFSKVYEDQDVGLIDKIADHLGLDSDQYGRVYYDPDIQDYFEHLLDVILNKAPKKIVVMGAGLTHLLLKKKVRLAKCRGTQYQLKFSSDSPAKTIESLMMPIFHPAYTRVNPALKEVTWSDLKSFLSN